MFVRIRFVLLLMSVVSEALLRNAMAAMLTCVCVLCRLRERHQDVLRQKLYKLKQEQGVESEPLFPIIKEEPESEQPV